MCGITAILGSGSDEREHARMLAVTARRGPEGSNVLRIPEGLLGHAALRFVAPADNPQPLLELDGSAIVYNGEVYNWRQLSASYALGAPNDTTTLLRGLKRFGGRFLREIDGQFAFVARVPTLEGVALVIARDKWGISPLVFGYGAGGQLCIASTPESLRRAGVVRPQTVPAGAMGVLLRERLTWNYWWKLPKPERVAVDSLADDEVRRTCEARVEARLTDAGSDLYTALGGMDSQFITATVARRSDGRFGGAVTVVPWRGDDPTNLRLGDYESATQTCEMLRREGLAVRHHVVQLTPECVEESLPRLLPLLGPDMFNLCCGLAEDLVASTVRRLGGRAVMTAGGPDEAGRSYKNWTLLHRDADVEQAWYEMGEQFAYSEGVRAGLVLGEHGLENRVPLADLIELAASIPPRDKQKVHSYGDGVDPARVVMDDKLFWRRAARGVLPEPVVRGEKVTIHGATGARAALLEVIRRDRSYAAARAELLGRARAKGWGAILHGDPSALDARNPVTECQLYLLHRWSLLEPDGFEAGAEQRYGRFVRGAPRFAHDLDERLRKPLCYDWLLGAGVAGVSAR